MNVEGKDPVKDTRDFVHQRQMAYMRTFSIENQDALKVLLDLAKFCRAGKSTFHTDPRVHTLLEGRREVWLRIQHHLKLDSNQLWNLLTRGE